MRKVKKILALQSQGKNRDEIAEIIGYKGDIGNMRGSLNRFMKGKGYELDMYDRYVNDDISVDSDDNCHLGIKLEANQTKSIEKKGSITIEAKDNKAEQQAIDKNVIINIVKADSEIKQMLEYFNSIKNCDDNSSQISNSDDSYKSDDKFKANNKIIIDLDTNEEQRTTIRVNKKVWSDFKDLCDDNSSLKYKDILSMALKEFTDKYR